MNDFPSLVARAVDGSLRRLRYPTFPIAPSRAGLLVQRLRPPARTKFSSLSQSLYNRPTLDCERQIALLMRRPLADIRCLLASNRQHNISFECRRNRVGSVKRVRGYCESFRIPQRREYLDLIDRDRRSRILVSFHCGDFLYGCASLLSLEQRTRRRFVLSLDPGSAASYKNLAAGFGPEAPGPECQLLHRRCRSAQLSQLLRAGNTTLLLFCDAPPGLNDSAQLRFLNRLAWFSIGPALLALANRVPLLPLLNYSDGETRQLLLGSQVEPMLLQSETLREGAVRITQALVALFESVFLEFPEQWRFVPLLPAYLCAPPQSPV